MTIDAFFKLKAYEYINSRTIAFKNCVKQAIKIYSKHEDLDNYLETKSLIQSKNSFFACTSN